MKGQAVEQLLTEADSDLRAKTRGSFLSVLGAFVRAFIVLPLISCAANAV